MPEEAAPFFSETQIAEVFGTAAPVEEPSVEVEAPEPAKETPSEEPKPASARIVAAKRAAARDEQRRQELRAKEEALSAKERTIAEQEQLAKLLEEDPAAYFEAKKLGPKGVQSFLERLAHGVKPEERAEKRLSAHEAELEALKKQIADKEETERAQKLNFERQRMLEEASTAFKSDVEANIEKYPHLAEEFTPDETVRMGLAVLEEVVGHDSKGRKITRGMAFRAAEGRDPNHDEIAEYIDGVAKARIETRQQNAWKKRLGAAGEPVPTGEANRTPQVNGAKPRTLSSKDTSTRATAPTAKWSQEWADAESIRILKEGVR